MKRRLAKWIARKLHDYGQRIEARLERERRGLCPDCGWLLVEHAAGIFRCDRCRAARMGPAQ